MKKARKILLTLCAALLLVTLSVGATIAYLTDTASVTNTFSVGKVKITMDEAVVDTNGDPTTGRTDEGNAYKLMPGHNYTKDPIIYVEDGSEECYVFVEVKNPIASMEADTTIDAQIKANGWTVLADATEAEYTTVYWKKVADVKDDEATELPVFAEFTLKDDAETTYAEDGEGYKAGDPKVFEDIVIKAYAIQADGMVAANGLTAEQVAWNNRPQ